MREKLFALSLGVGALILVAQSQAATQGGLIPFMTIQKPCAIYSCAAGLR